MLGMRLSLLGPVKSLEFVESSRGERQTRQPGTRIWNDVNAVAVVVEGGFVDQSRANCVSRVDNRAVGRITEGIADCGNVGAAPLADRVTLRDLLGNVMSEDGEFVSEVVVDANDFFPQVRRSTRAAEELVSCRGFRENACVRKSRRHSGKSCRTE